MSIKGRFALLENRREFLGVKQFVVWRRVNGSLLRSLKLIFGLVRAEIKLLSIIHVPLPAPMLLSYHDSAQCASHRLP